MTVLIRQLVVCQLVIFLLGCAANTKQIEVQQAPLAQFDASTCEDLEGVYAQLFENATEVGARVDKTAAFDDQQVAMGVTLFWPSLFFLEGKETDDTQHFSMLLGEMEAVKHVSADKGCFINFEPLNATGRMHMPDEPASRR